MDVDEMKKMMSASSADDRKKGMEAWATWMKNHTVDFADMGGQVGKNTQVSKSGSAEKSNDLGGYSVLLADSKEAAAALLADSPHFAMPGATVDLMEITSMGA